MMDKRNLKIVGLYIISLACIVCYFLLEHYNFIFEFYEKNKYSEYPSNVFAVLIFRGLLQYGLLVIGTCIFIMLSFFLIKEKISKNRKS